MGSARGGLTLSRSRSSGLSWERSRRNSRPDSAAAERSGQPKPALCVGPAPLLVGLG